MSVWQAVFLGVVQGLTEFLPVSSSGHLVLLSHALGVQEPCITFEVVVHFGSLVAIVMVFWPELSRLAVATLSLIRSSPAKWSSNWRHDPDVRLLAAIAAGTVPAVFVALTLQDTIVQAFSFPGLAGAMLLVTGTILFVSDRLPQGRVLLGQITPLRALLIGLGQAFAILPGISRSGTTISVALATGVQRHDAARFSFLLAIPALVGATVLILGDLWTGAVAIPTVSLVAGAIASFVASYFAIRTLLLVIRRGKLVYFSYYTWAAGLLVLWLIYGQELLL